MAKKRRHRVWYFALYPEQYKSLTVERVLPNPCVLFDKPELAYSIGYAHRFEPLLDADGKHVTVSDYAQLKDNGRITVVGINGDSIDWKKAVTERFPDGQGESVYLEQSIKLTDRVVNMIKEETDELYARHLKSPLARAGGLTVPEDVKERIEARVIAEEAKRQIAEQAERAKGENSDGEDAGATTDAVTA